MKAYIRLTDYAEDSTCETVKAILKAKLSYGWKLISVKPVTDQFYDYMVITEKTGRTDINTRPF